MISPFLLFSHSTDSILLAITNLDEFLCKWHGMAKITGSKAAAKRTAEFSVPKLKGMHFSNSDVLTEQNDTLYEYFF